MLVASYSPDISGLESRVGGRKMFIFTSVHTGRVAHPAYNGYRGYLPVVKRPELPLTAHSHLYPW